MQTPIITQQQRKALEVCAQKISGGYSQLPPYAIIARLMQIEGKDCGDAVKGYRLMRSLEIIPTSFVMGGLEVETRLLSTFFHPVFCEMVTRLGLELDKWDMQLGPLRAGDKPLSLEKASEGEVTKYLTDYKQQNGVAYGDDNKQRIDTRESIKALSLSLDDEIPQETINTLTEMTKPHIEKVYRDAGVTGYGKHEHNEKDHIETSELTKRITDTILGLDTDF